MTALECRLGVPASAPAARRVATESPLYGVPVHVIAQACDVHADTARRWKRQGRAPAGALALIRALWNYELGSVSAPWEGWCLRHGELVSPAGDRFTPGMVLAGKYHREGVAELSRQLAAASEFLVRLIAEYFAKCERVAELERGCQQLLLAAKRARNQDEALN